MGEGRKRGRNEGRKEKGLSMGGTRSVVDDINLKFERCDNSGLNLSSSSITNTFAYVYRLPPNCYQFFFKVHVASV